LPDNDTSQRQGIVLFLLTVLADETAAQILFQKNVLEPHASIIRLNSRGQVRNLFFANARAVKLASPQPGLQDLSSGLSSGRHSFILSF
jgi:hypothetical protein